MQVYYDKDADLSIIQGMNVAVIGYGSQGHAHANNLNDSGVGNVCVGLRADSGSWRKAENAGLKVAEVPDAVRDADLVMILTPDELQPTLYREQIEPNLKPIYFKLQKKFLESPARAQLTEPPFPLLARRWQADVDLFREENIPLQTNVGGGLGSLASLAGAAGGAGGGAGAAAGLAALGGLGGGFSAPREDVGNKIKVTPHINKSDQVRLEIVDIWHFGLSELIRAGRVGAEACDEGVVAALEDGHGGLARE